MERQGKFESYDAVKGILSFTVGKVSPEELQQLVTADTLRITAKKYVAKRSLDANAYMWALVSKLAEKLRSSKEEIYEELIQKYGIETDILVSVKSEVDMSKVDGHWRLHKESKDGKWKAYRMIRGTSTYDRREMAYFVDMVVDECKAQGIETLTPRELQEMYSLIEEKK